MDLESLFSLCNLSVLPVWLLLIVLPRWRVTHLVVASCAIPLLLAVVYLVLIAGNLRGAEGGFGSLAGVASLFESRPILLAGWVHYLAFDLFIGGWEVRDAQRRSIPHFLVIPCLILTFMLGPVGLLLYFVIRLSRGHGLIIEDASV